METIRSTIIPRRVTQLYADTKKSYENVVQTNHAGPQLSSVHLKLRIQKDRLIAWGLEWSDANEAHTEDIDGSLDRAGISDLVASIMSSIRNLLDEAERLQPSQDADLPVNYREMKTESKSAQDLYWTTENLRRLEEILRDLTTSIDTLCLLSRSRVKGRKQKKPVLAKDDEFVSHDSGTKNMIPRKTVASSDSDVATREMSPQPKGFTALARIQSYQLRIFSLVDRSGSSPPSYESVAAGSEDRLLAFYTPCAPTSPPEKSPVGQSLEIPVLLDYGCVREHGPYTGLGPDRERYEELSTALQRYSEESATGYCGLLKLIGWTVDSNRRRCAYVYEIPPSNNSEKSCEIDLQPRSLLSFLQNGADTDSTNMPSLENRFRLAFHIASSIQQLHARGVLHGNLNSNNIVFFTNNIPAVASGRIWKGPVIRKPYLIAFDQSALDVPSFAEEPTSSSIYRHPLVGEAQDRRYKVAYDYYSLGLILLEIGLWMPLGKFWKHKYTRRDFKSRLQDVYLRKLSAKCGSGYMRAVLFCLTAADESPQALSSEEQKAGQAQQRDTIETDYQLEVAQTLARCCMIDRTDHLEHLSSASGKGGVQSILGTRAITGAPLEKKVIQEKIASLVEHQFSLDTGDAATKSKTGRKSHVVDKSLLGKKFRVWSHDIPNLYTSYWRCEMFPKLDRILKKAISRWETLNIELLMAGEASDVARPTIYVECLSTDKVRRILRHLNKDLRLFEIKVVTGQLIRSKAGKKRRKKAQKASEPTTPNVNFSNQEDHNADKLLNPNYQQKPTCGASLGAFRGGKHLPAVSFGGTVLVDGAPFGMSVHHMLEDDDELEIGLDDRIDSQRSMAPRQYLPLVAANARLSIANDSDSGLDHKKNSGGESDDVHSTFGDGSVDSFSRAEWPNQASFEPLYPFEISEDEADNELDQSSIDEDFWLSPDFEAQLQEEGDSDEAVLGDTLGIDVGKGEHLLITQPAIDDVGENFFPTDEDKDEEHLSSHTLGHVHASSGIRRSRREELVHEIDWALMKVHGDRIHTCNIVEGGGRYCQSTMESSLASKVTLPPSHTIHADSYPTSTIPASRLGNLKVHALGRTSGLSSGVILPSMQMVRLPGRTSLSHSWQVQGNFGSGGDSGAWVIDNATGSVAGHVLGYSTKKNVACIAPMEVLLEDMAGVLGKKVELPGIGMALKLDTMSIRENGDVTTVGDNSDDVDGDRIEDLVQRLSSPELPTSPPASFQHQESSSSTLNLQLGNSARSSPAAEATHSSSSTQNSRNTLYRTEYVSASASDPREDGFAGRMSEVDVGIRLRRKSTMMIGSRPASVEARC
ncbi:hypothetical protein MMC06_001872 [Schaereria dolodes]|nr:hypothetical protein [Schaereria dolodes]